MILDVNKYMQHSPCYFDSLLNFALPQDITGLGFLNLFERIFIGGKSSFFLDGAGGRVIDSCKLEELQISQAKPMYTTVLAIRRSILTQ